MPSRDGRVSLELLVTKCISSRNFRRQRGMTIGVFFLRMEGRFQRFNCGLAS
jgi:hypothetical protein